MSRRNIGVIAGLDPAIHQSKTCRVIVGMDARVKPAHGERLCCSRCENPTKGEIV